MHRVIIDGDWGGDEMQLAAVLLAHPRQAQVLGATCVFGNTTLPRVVRNACDILNFIKATPIDVYPGCETPNGQTLSEGDNAHSADGIGGVVLPRSTVAARSTHAVDFIVDTLRHEPSSTVTITATGPLSNIAAAWQKDPDSMRRMAGLVIMGGCTEDMPAADRETRCGNITSTAEFNFYMAARDAATIMDSGLPITLLPMNCTHQLTLTPARERSLRTALFQDGTMADLVTGMMKAPEEIDRRKFGAAPVMHDVHTALQMLYPGLYEGRRGHVRVTENGPDRGRSDFQPDGNGTIRVMETVKDPDRMFRIVSDSLRKRLVPEPSDQNSQLKAPNPG